MRIKEYTANPYSAFWLFISRKRTKLRFHSFEELILLKRFLYKYLTPDTRKTVSRASISQKAFVHFVVTT